MVGDWRTERALLFRDDTDRLRFLDQLEERVEQHGVRLYLFSLMANHFHLAFETPQANCSTIMQSLLTAYTVYFNLRHRRHGHLFDGRYKAKLVEGDEYLLSLSRYIHLNPVRVRAVEKLPLADRVQFLRSYRWSSYPGYIGRRKKLEFVCSGPVLGQMSGPVKGQMARYRRFVEMGMVENDEDFELILKASPRSLGGDGFRAWVDELHEQRLQERGSPEDVSFRHTTEPLDPAVVFGVLCDVLQVDQEEFHRRKRSSPLRAVAAKYLIQYAGLNQRDVAQRLDAGSGAAISKQLSRFADGGQEDRALVLKMKKIDMALKKLRKGHTGNES
jgi:REP element-mobilizing transposase RayT